MNREQALEVVGRGRYDDFLGIFESDELEFKSAPYRLETLKGPYELAKDVSGLANHHGGLIIVGMWTHRDDVSRRDVARGVSLFRQEIVNVPQLTAVIATKVYPEIEGISAEWKPSADDRTRGVLLIDVPPQREERKYFLIAQPVDEDEPVPGYLIGLARRRGEDVLSERIQDIYRLLRDGRNIFPRLTAIETQLERIDSQREAPLPAGDAEPDEMVAVQETLEEFS